MTRTLVGAVLLAALVPTVAFAQAPPAASVVVTQGEATVKKAPDQAWVSMATETREARAADARRRGAESMTALQAALKATGLPADAIRTTGYSLMPEMEWNNGRGTVKGYLVRNQIEVRVDDLDRLGEVIDTANTSKSTSVTVTGPRFGLKDAAAAENEALRLAVQAAMGRAQAIAAGARRAVGSILRIEENNAAGFVPRPEPMVMRMAKADAVETPINPGELEIRAVVTLTIELR